MTTGPVLVVGAGGNVGGAVVHALLERGLETRPAGRDPQRLAAQFPTTRPVLLDLRDPATFRPAVEDVERMFLLRPPSVARVGPTLNALVDEGLRAGLSHVVFASVAGADENRVVPHHRVETHLASSGVGHTILRPGFFAQNLGGAYREDIRSDDRLHVPAGDGRAAFVDVRDLGEVAATALAEPDEHAGAGYELTGPEAITFDDVAGLLTEALGRRITYEPATVLGYARHLRRRGLPVVQAVVQTVLHVGLRRGDAQTVDPTLQQLLGRPPLTMHDYVTDHAPLWQRDG